MNQKRVRLKRHSIMWKWLFRKEKALLWIAMQGHVLDIQHVGADGGLQEGLFLLKEAFPFGRVWDEFDNPSFQADHCPPPVVFRPLG